MSDAVISSPVKTQFPLKKSTSSSKINFPWISTSRERQLPRAGRSRRLRSSSSLSGRRMPSNGTPYTLHPTPYTLHRLPFTLRPTPYTLHTTHYPLHPKHKTRTVHPAWGTSLIRNTPPPSDHLRTLGTVILQGPRGTLSPMSELPLYTLHSKPENRHRKPQSPHRPRPSRSISVKLPTCALHPKPETRNLDPLKHRTVQDSKSQYLSSFLVKSTTPGEKDARKWDTLNRTNPRTVTRKPKPQNPKPETFNPSTLNPKP